MAEKTPKAGLHQLVEMQSLLLPFTPAGKTRQSHNNRQWVGGKAGLARADDSAGVPCRTPLSARRHMTATSKPRIPSLVLAGFEDFSKLGFANGSRFPSGGRRFQSGDDGRGAGHSRATALLTSAR
ncbi:MAG: hypothetical protein ACQESR_13140 [Planctomycetota bacterium]